MKNYPNFEERVRQDRDAMQEKYAELKLFQSLLRESNSMNERYHGRALEIADGLQPWIDALEQSLLR